jgi:hypothetical protein
MCKPDAKGKQTGAGPLGGDGEQQIIHTWEISVQKEISHVFTGVSKRENLFPWKRLPQVFTPGRL